MTGTVSVGTAGGGARPASLARAFLALHEPVPSTAGGARPGAEVGRVTFQFNPAELTMTKSARWSAEPSRSAERAGPPEFQGAEPARLSVEMFFDATDTMDARVVTAVERLFSCCVPTDASLGRRRPSPPIVILRWGTVTGFPAYVTSVSTRYSLFTPGGTPVRATCAVELQELPVPTARQNPTSGSLTARRTHTLCDGETLASLAYAEYGDATLWRALGHANDIDDPLRLRAGATILLPPPDELLVPSGRAGVRR